MSIPHIFKPQPGAIFASRASDPRPRLAALSISLASLHQLFGGRQYAFDFADMQAWQANASDSNVIDVVICTTGRDHLLGRLKAPSGSYTQRSTNADPMLLGFECQVVLKEAIGQYDYYCYLEDDIAVRDPWLFAKLAWFTDMAGDGALLQPNRFERDRLGGGRKAYVDGHIPPEQTVTLRGKNAVVQRGKPVVKASALGRKVVFERALNPHSGCFFLNAKQMKHWAQQSYFLDRDTSFVDPIASAATLGIMRTFDIYKPAAEYANFMEVEHYGALFLARVEDYPAERRPPFPLRGQRIVASSSEDTQAPRTQTRSRARRKRRH
ncbi:MAG: calcium-binding protein [Solirubrobacteraceae bacterium]